MLDFQPITESSVKQIAPFLFENPTRFCDYTTVDLFTWAGQFYKAYAIKDDMLYLQLSAYDQGPALYAPPIGAGDQRQALCELRDHAVRNGEPLRLSLVAEVQLPLISDTLGAQWRATAYRDWCDYIYDAKAMAAFDGKAYAKQRNHLRRFERLYPDARVEALEDAHIEPIGQFLNVFARTRDSLDELALKEISLTTKALRQRDLLGLVGVVLYVEDRLVGFSAGCRSRDTLFVNFEKADIAVSGAYQKLVKSFSERFVDEDILFINREEDCGVEGLRRSKLAYHPTELLYKYTVDFGS